MTFFRIKNKIYHRNVTMSTISFLQHKKTSYDLAFSHTDLTLTYFGLH